MLKTQRSLTSSSTGCEPSWNPYLAGGKQRDFSSKIGATLLAGMIEAAWRARGYPEVKTEIAEIIPRKVAAPLGKITPAHRPHWLVTSNLINGLPPSVYEARKKALDKATEAVAPSGRSS